MLVAVFVEPTNNKIAIEQMSVFLTFCKSSLSWCFYYRLFAQQSTDDVFFLLPEYFDDDNDNVDEDK